MERKLLKNIEYPILVCVILITILSVLIISSATHAGAPGGSFRTARMQIIWFGAGLVGMAFMMFIDYHSFAHWSNIIYALNIGTLLLVIFIGQEGGGAQRWIDIGPFGFQSVRICQTSHCDNSGSTYGKKKSLNQLKDLFSIFTCSSSYIAYSKTTGFSTSLVLIAMVFGVMFVAGLDYKLLAWIIAAGVFLYLCCGSS